MGEKRKILILLVSLLLISLIGFISAEDNSTSNESTTTLNTTETPVTLEEPSISLTVSDSSIETDEEITVTFSIDNGDYTINKINLSYGDGKSDSITTNSEGLYTIEKEYNEAGSYKINVTITTTTGLKKSKTKTITVSEPEVNDEKPKLELIYPSDKLLLKTDKLTFSFKATDDWKLSKCTYEIYKKEGSWKTLDYNTTVTNPLNNTQYDISLEKFEDANYTWYVICYDNSSQQIQSSRELTIQTTSHEREKEILKLIENIDEFMEKEETLSLEEKEALTELKILDNMKYYKKRLLQINQDLGNNIKFIADANLRETRKAETIAEFEKIKKELPLDIEVLANEDFLKNSLTIDMEKTVNDYSEIKKLELSKRQLKKMTKLNTEIQSKISVSTNLKKVKIKYNSSEKIITLVKKEFTISDPTYTKILEIIPESTNKKISFETKSGELNENMYEISLKDLDENIISYSFEGDVNLNVLKDTETVLFEEESNSKSGITGYFVLNTDVQNELMYIIIGILFLIILTFGIQKGLRYKDVSNLKKEENVARTIHYLKESKFAIAKENLEKAKDNYHKIKENYKLIPDEIKNEIYEKTEKLRIEIDKREIREFIREFEKAKIEKRDNDAKMIYEKIKLKYKNLPKKYQQKVYERVILKNF